MNRITAVLTVALLWPCPAAPAQDPKQLDSTVVAAWQSAGAEVGWYGRTKDGGVGYTTRKPDDDMALPAITLWWKPPPGGNPGGQPLNPGCSVAQPLKPQNLILQPVELSKLPAPTVPFALFLDSMMAMDSLTDAGMRDIARFKTLQHLSISGTRITDVGMKEFLAFNDNLQELNLGGLHISDAGLKYLVKFQGLRCLSLSRARVTDAGMKNRARVTDAGMKNLARLKNLQILGLAGTGVSDAGLKELAGLANPEILGLDETRVTDAGMKELSGMKNFKSLSLSATKVTDAGVAQLQKALPKLTIFR